MSFAPHVGAVIGGKYRLERAVAEGGMGSVWLATHVQLETPAAVKFMHAALGRDLVQRFEREAKACARLNSPHIVKVHDFGDVESMPFMVMEYLEGETAAERLRRTGVFSLESASALMDALAKGLSVAHEAGIVHRDLKPANVFFARVGKEEVVKIVDFGIARESSRSPEDRTETGIVLGSPHHMSPEQAGGLEVDGRSDAWSAGVLLYQLLTGKRPFDGNGMSAVIYAIATTTPPAPSAHRPELPQSVDAFFGRALQREVGRRFQTMDEMAHAFHLAIGGAARPEQSMSASLSVSGEVVGAPIPSDPVTPFPTGSQVLRGLAGVALTPKRSSRPGLVVGAVVAIALGAGFAIMASRSSDAPASSAATERTALPPATPTPTVVVAPATSIAASTAQASASASASAPTGKSASTSAKPQPTATAPTAVKTVTAPKTGCPAGKTRDAFTGLCVSG